MKRHLKIKVVALLLVGLLAAAGGVYAVHEVQVNRRVEATFQAAKRAQQDGDLEKAERNLRLYLGYRPEDNDTLVDYALVLDQRAETSEEVVAAVMALEQAIRRVPGHRAARRKAADRLMQLGRFDDARTHLEDLLGRDEPEVANDDEEEARPEEGELEQLIALCAVAAEDFEEAEAWYEAAIRHAPHRIESYYQLAELRRTRLGAVEAADRVMDLPEVGDGLVAANGASAEAFLARALYRAQFGVDGAGEDVARALELAPDDADVLVAAATQALDAQDLDAARGHLEHGLKLHPEDARMHDVLAQVDARSGRREQAMEHLRRGVEVADGAEQRLPLLWRLGTLLIDGAEYDKLPEVKDRLEEDQVRPEVLAFLEARVQIARGEWPAAARTLEAVLPRLPSRSDLELAYQANLLLGHCYEQLGQTDRRLAAFRRAVEDDPQGAPGQVGLAATLAAMGRVDEALAAYRRVVDQVPAAKVDVARLLLVRTLSLPEPRRDPRAWQEVDHALDEAASAAPDAVAVDVPILRAQTLAARGELDAARDLVAQARDEHPEEVRLWAVLAGLTRARSGLDAGMAVLDQAEQTLGDGVDLRLARAVLAAGRGGDEARKTLAPLEQDLGEFSPEERQRLLRGLAATYRQLGDTEAAAPLLDRVVREQPDDLASRISLFDLAVQADDEAAMKRLPGEIRRIEGEDGTFWRYCHARHLIWRARQGTGATDEAALAEARRLLAEAAQQRPDWALLALAQGDIENLEGDADQTIIHYLRAIDLGEARPEVLARAAGLLAARGRLQEADEVVRKAQDAEGNLRDPRLRRLAAEVALQSGDARRALALARGLDLAGSDDYRDHIWLGQVLAAAEVADEAEAELRKAVALAGDAPEAWTALVQLLARTDRPAAEAAIEQARGRLPGGGAALTLGRLYLAVGRTDRAREQFQAALAAEPDDVAALRAVANLDLVDGRLPEAQEHLRTLVGLAARDPSAAASARRLLAFLIAATGNRQQSREALAMLGLSDDVSEYRPGPSESIEDLRALAGVLATRQDRASRRAAIRVLEHVEGRGSPTPGDQFLLAQLEWFERDWPAYRDRMQALIATDAENLTYLNHYVNVLLVREDAGEAALWLRQLQRLAPEALQTTALRARLLKAQGQDEEAAGLLESAAAGQDELVRPVAQQLEGLGAAAAAERMYRKFAERSGEPQAPLVLAGFLSRQGRIDEALDLCDRAWQDCEPALVGNVTVQVLFAGSATEEQLRRGAGRVEQATRQHPQLVSLRFDLANILSIWGRPDEALAIYRKIYEDDSTKSGPLNNMAWLLALQGAGGDEALSLVNKAIEIEGETTDLLDTRAMVYLTTDRPDAAVEDLDDAIALGPNPDKYFHLARAHLAADRRDRAAEAFREAVGLGLEEGDLHPLEREDFRRVRQELDSE